MESVRLSNIKLSNFLHIDCSFNNWCGYFEKITNKIITLGFYAIYGMTNCKSFQQHSPK